MPNTTIGFMPAIATPIPTAAKATLNVLTPPAAVVKAPLMLLPKPVNAGPITSAASLNPSIVD